MTKKELYQLLQRYQNNTATQEEIKLINTWMLLSESNDDSSLDAETIASAKASIWHKIADSNSFNQSEETTPIVPIKRFNWLRYAAVFIAIASLGLISYIFRYQLLDTINPIESITLETGAFEVKTAFLPDSSIVVLNENSKLIYPKTFRGHNRLVAVSGRAFFEVKRNEAHPFIINSDNVDVQVLGTSFEVNNASNSDTAIVTVVTGKVKVNDTNNQYAIALPNQQVVLYKKKHHMKLIPVTTTEDIVSWINYKLNFEETALVSVLEKISEQYNTTIHFNEQQLKQSGTFSGAFKYNEPLEDALEIICISTGLKWKYNKKDASYSIID